MILRILKTIYKSKHTKTLFICAILAVNFVNLILILKGDPETNGRIESDSVITTQVKTRETPVEHDDKPVYISEAQMLAMALPGLHVYLPHLAGRLDRMMPRFNLTGPRQRSVTYVIGIPSIRRRIRNYLLDTVDQLFGAMNKHEKDQVLVIVCVTEPWNEEFELDTLDSFVERFPSELESGHLEVITPKKDYYPNMTNIQTTLRDTPERVKWRSKQNLDYAYLMLHAVHKGRYYIQLEDDVTAKYGFVTKMTEAITKQRNQDWVILQLSSLGFIGRLFHTPRDATRLLEYLVMFYEKLPCDWLLGNYLRNMVCGHDSFDKCRQKVRLIAPQIKPSLFQHTGARSSLEGTKNELKDRDFDIDQVVSFHANPVAQNITTTIKLLKKQYSVMEVYLGEGFFWGVSPKQNDTIDFIFNPPVRFKRLYFVSGRYFVNRFGGANINSNNIFDSSTAVVEVWTGSSADDIRTVGRFNDDGTCDAMIPPDVGPITLVTLRVERNMRRWVILQQIEFVPVDGT